MHRPLCLPTYTYTFADHAYAQTFIYKYRSLLDSVVGICIEI